MKPGRFAFSVPRPYSTHAPRLGRGNWKMPQCIWMNACGWFGRSVCMPLSRQSLSACFASSGNSSLIHSPLSPRFSNLNGEPMSLPAAEPAASAGRRFAVVGRQLRLVVEGIDVARRAVHAQEDDALGLRGEVRLLRRERRWHRQSRPRSLLVRERREREVAEAGGGRFQKRAPGEHGSAPECIGSLPLSCLQPLRAKNHGCVTSGTETPRWRRVPDRTRPTPRARGEWPRRAPSPVGLCTPSGTSPRRPVPFRQAGGRRSSGTPRGCARSRSSCSSASFSAAASAERITNGLFSRNKPCDGHRRRRSVGGDEARVRRVEQRQRLGQVVADDRQVDRPLRVPRVVDRLRNVRAGPRPNASGPPPTGPSPARATTEPVGGVASSWPLTASIESRRLSASSRRGDIRHRSAFSGSTSNDALIELRIELIRVAHHDALDELLHAPAVVHEGESEMVEQFRDASAAGRRRRSCRRSAPARGRTGAATRGSPSRGPSADCPSKRSSSRVRAGRYLCDRP